MELLSTNARQAPLLVIQYQDCLTAAPSSDDLHWLPQRESRRMQGGLSAGVIEVLDDTRHREALIRGILKTPSLPRLY